MNIDDLNERKAIVFKAAKKRLGSPRGLEAIAAYLTEHSSRRVSVAALMKWKNGVPPHHVRALSDLTGIADHEIRPDLYRAPGSDGPSVEPGSERAA